jgi:hypothetical protein
VPCAFMALTYGAVAGQAHTPGERASHNLPVARLMVSDAVMDDLRVPQLPGRPSLISKIFGVRGSVAMHRLANLVTLCDVHGIMFVAASLQIRLGASTLTEP